MNRLAGRRRQLRADHLQRDGLLAVRWGSVRVLDLVVSFTARSRSRTGCRRRFALVPLADLVDNLSTAPTVAMAVLFLGGATLGTAVSLWRSRCPARRRGAADRVLRRSMPRSRSR